MPLTDLRSLSADKIARRLLQVNRPPGPAATGSATLVSAMVLRFLVMRISSGEVVHRPRR